MRLGAVLLISSLASSCATFPRVPPASSDERCHELEGDYQFWGALGVGLKAFSVGGAAATPAPKDDGVRWAVGLSSAALAGLGLAADFVADDTLDLYVSECGEAEPDLAETSTMSARPG